MNQNLRKTPGFHSEEPNRPNLPTLQSFKGTKENRDLKVFSSLQRKKAANFPLTMAK